MNEFLLSIQHQTKLTHFNDAGSISSINASLIDFSGLCRLELKVSMSELLVLFNKNLYIRV